MNLNHLICPVSNRKIDGNVSRMTVFINVVMMVLYLITYQPILIIGVSVDCFIRAIPLPDLSHVRAIAIKIISLTSLEKKTIDLAPKVFASRLGFTCAATATLLYFLGYPLGSILVTCLLMVLSIMDSVFDFCVGCLIYHHLVHPFFKNK